MATIPSGRGRGWVPLAAVAVAFVMVFVVLPNPFRIPSNDPSTAAEYAPVPGKKDSASRAGSFSSVGFAEGSGLGGAPPPAPTAPPLPTKGPNNRSGRPRQNRCVVIEGVPHQTEDPLSPICVPFYEGDNGGATMQGVTADEIRVVLYNDLGYPKGFDFSQPYSPSDETGPQADFEHRNIIRTIKALNRYFQNRYQTYGRRIRLLNYPGQLNAPKSQQEGAALSVQQEFKPAAVVHLGNNAQYFLAKMSQFGVPGFGLQQDVPSDTYEQNKPYIWSFTPDQETQTDWSASFLCRKIIGGKARLSTDSELKNKDRKIGLIYGRGATSQLDEYADLLKKDLGQQCGFTFAKEQSYSGAGAAGAGVNEANDMMLSMKLAGITTIVCYCIPVEGTVTAMQNAATGADYHPEWYWDAATYMDRGIWWQLYGSKEQPSFGTTYFWKQPAYRQQYHYQAYLEEEPGTVPNTRFNFTIYHLMLNLFSGIQGAGPKLQPGWSERGMFTFKYRNQANPSYLPIGGYGPGGPSFYTFIDTGMGFWWDPTGTPPGGQQNEGCLRVMNNGKRYATGEWPKGDADLMLPGDPCSEDTRKITPQEGDART